MASQYVPELHSIASNLTYRENNKDVYSYSVNPSTNNGLTCSNQQDFNMIEVVIESSFDVNDTIGPLPAYPNYINDVRLGIVKGMVIFRHTSLSSGNI